MLSIFLLSDVFTTTLANISGLRRYPGFESIMRSFITLLDGSRTFIILSIFPRNILPGYDNVVMLTLSPILTNDIFDSYTFAITHTFFKSEMVKSPVALSERIIMLLFTCLSTTKPLMGDLTGYSPDILPPFRFKTR